MKFSVPALIVLGVSPLSADYSPVPDEVFAVLRVVVDEEGKANVRSGPSLTSAVAGQVVSGSVVSVEPDQEGPWMKLTEDVGGEKPRYIHVSRLKKLNSWTQTGPVGEGPLKAAVEQEGWSVQVTAVPFVAGDHKITRDAQGQELVDGESPWGRDGGLPAMSLSLTVGLDGKTVEIPRAACANLYEPSMETLVLLTPGKGKEKGQAVIFMRNSDGAGGYCVAWAFKDGRYAGREVFVPF